MNLFQTLKEQLTTHQVAEHYGLTIGRNRMVCCPFHPDKTPSMKLNDDYYYCFGCGAYGDVVDLAAGLLGLKPYDAAKQLASDFGILEDGILMPAVSKSPPKKSMRMMEQLCTAYLTHYLLLLQDWEQTYSPKTAEDGLDWRFAIACHDRSYVEHLLDCMDDDPTQMTQWMLDEGIINKLQKKIDPYLREEGYHARHFTTTLAR